MSFLKPDGGDAGGLNPASMNPSQYLDYMGGGDGSGGNDRGAQIRMIADRIGTGANQIANAGGATPGYAAPQSGNILPAYAGQAGAAPVNNHLQLLDPNVLQRITQMFGGSGTGIRPVPTGMVQSQ